MSCMNSARDADGRPPKLDLIHSLVSATQGISNTNLSIVQGDVEVTQQQDTVRIRQGSQKCVIRAK